MAKPVWRALLVVVAAVVALTSCSQGRFAALEPHSTAGSQDRPSGPASAPTSAATSSTPSEQSTPEYPPPCLSPAELKHYRTIPVPAGRLEVMEYGHGPAGVLLLHQSYGDLCQWQFYAKILAARGYHVMTLTYLRDFIPETKAAVAELRRSGATSIVLIGASMGAAIALGTAPTLTPQPRAVVSLSGPSGYIEVDALMAVPKITGAVFFAASSDDEPFASEEQQLYDAASHAKARQLVMMPGSAHGIDFLQSESRVRVAMETFLRTYAPV